MAYTYYKSNTDGTKGVEITSGETGALFSDLTYQERLSGDQEFSKMWIESDTDIITSFGIYTPSNYISNVFLSASESDAVGDLTGAEDRFGALVVISSDVDSITVEEDATYVYVRAGDGIVYQADIYIVSGVVDNGDSTLTITMTTNIVTSPTVGDYITSTFSLSLLTGVAQSIWREEKVIAGSVKHSDFETTQILIVG